MCLFRIFCAGFCAAMLASLAACDSENASAGVAAAQIENDFDNPESTGGQAPWTICRSSFQTADFGKILPGVTSDVRYVAAGEDYVLMVASWNDPNCAPAHSLPIASANLEAVEPGTLRTIVIGMSNHQGPCPPQGVAGISEEQYERILKLWPEFNFKPFADRALNSQCQDGGVPPDAASDSGSQSDANVDASLD